MRHVESTVGVRQWFAKPRAGLRHPIEGSYQNLWTVHMEDVLFLILFGLNKLQQRQMLRPTGCYTYHHMRFHQHSV